MDVAHDGFVDGDVALAAAGGDDHVGAGEQLRVALETGVVEREARREHAEPLPGLHLPLITPPRDLRVEVEGGRGMERPRQALAIDHGRAPLMSASKVARAVAPSDVTSRSR